MESVAPRGRKTGPADKNHSRCVTYRFECDGRRSPPIRPLPCFRLPRAPCSRAPLLVSTLSLSYVPISAELSLSLSFVPLAQYTNPIAGDLIRANLETPVKYPLSRERSIFEPHERSQSFLVSSRARLRVPRVFRGCCNLEKPASRFDIIIERSTRRFIIPSPRRAARFLYCSCVRRRPGRRLLLPRSSRAVFVPTALSFENSVSASLEILSEVSDAEIVPLDCAA